MSILLLLLLMLVSALTGCGGSVGTEAAVPVSSASPGTGTGIATLAWSAPTTNADGSPLTNLAGYKIYYGVASGSYSSNIDVGDNTTYQVGNLTAGTTYYFTVTSYNTSGIESAHSNEVSKLVN